MVLGCSGVFYLLVKVVVESNQVEIAFEALQSPLEEILFGAAPLEAKDRESVMLSAAAPSRPGGLEKALQTLWGFILFFQ